MGLRGRYYDTLWGKYKTKRKSDVTSKVDDVYTKFFTDFYGLSSSEKDSS